MVSKSCFIIAVDGHAASGKGTLAKLLASHYGFAHLDTGGLYRRAGLMLIENKADLQNLEEVLKQLAHLDPARILPPSVLHSEEVGRAASQIGVIPEVRQMLNKLQYDFPLGKKGVVIDGRDIGTVIFPNAQMKLFVTASLESRAKRRYNQLISEGKEVIFDRVLEDLRERDERDVKRAVAPTVAASDAIVIDTSQLDANAVFNLVLTLTQKAVACHLAA